MEARAMLRDANRTVPCPLDCVGQREGENKTEQARNRAKQREEERERDNLCHADGGCGSEAERKVRLEIASKQESCQGETFKHQLLLYADLTPPLHNARHSLSSGLHAGCLKPFLDDVRFGVTNVATVVHLLA